MDASHYDIVRERLQKVGLLEGLTVDKRGVWFRKDFSELEDVQYEYGELRDDLERARLYLEDPCIEHDCISGYLEFIPETEPKTHQ